MREAKITHVADGEEGEPRVPAKQLHIGVEDGKSETNETYIERKFGRIITLMKQLLMNCCRALNKCFVCVTCTIILGKKH